MMLIRYVYTSAATHPFDVNPHLPRILKASLRNNAELGVTGFLLYGNGMFAQCLEGSGDAVAGLAQRIEDDSAHGALRVLQIIACRERLFAGSSMGFHVPDTREDRLHVQDVLKSGDVAAVLEMLQHGAKAAQRLNDPKVALFQSAERVQAQVAGHAG